MKRTLTHAQKGWKTRVKNTLDARRKAADAAAQTPNYEHLKAFSLPSDTLSEHDVQRIAQSVISRYVTPRLELTAEPLPPTERGAKGFGSTGRLGTPKTHPKTP